MINETLRLMLKIFAVFIISCFYSAAVIIDYYKYIDPPITPFMFISHYRGGSPGQDILRIPVSVDTLPPHLITALLAAEDSRFFCHRGFDFNAIKIALKNNMEDGPVRGGSTISQQTAKNLLLWPGRSWFRKGLEAALTLYIESSWSKKRILEVYLNAAEFGRGIFGIEAASRFYFSKPASILGRAESVRLVSILPYPLKKSPVDPDSGLRRKQMKISRKMAGVPFAGFDCEFDCQEQRFPVDTQ